MTAGNNAGPGKAVFIVFKRLLSAVFIIGDVLIDWTSLSDVTKGTLSNGTAQARDNLFTFSLPNIDDALKVLNMSSTENNKCDSSTFKLTVSYGSFVIFGSAFAVVKCINIVGETIREIGEEKEKKKEKKDRNVVGFQMLHGWTETLFALFLEDIPQNILIIFYSNSCKGYALSKTKTMVSIIVSFFKNIIRKSTCKQKSACACGLVTYDIGCLGCTCLSCVLCSCCKSAQNYFPDGSRLKAKQENVEDYKEWCMCCKLIELEWGCELNIPPGCACCRCIFIKQMGCCAAAYEDKECCKPDCYGCCGKKLDKDPLWIEKYIKLGFLVNIAVFILYVTEWTYPKILNEAEL